MQTVISAFDDYQTAQRAVERLVDAGFDRDDVHVQQGMSSGPSSATGGTSNTGSGTVYQDEDRGILSSIGHFFASLFGQDDDVRTGQAGTYAEAVKRGSSVVVVDAQTEEQAERAANLMQEMGAVDVDERAHQWRQTGWTGYEADSDTTLSGGAQPQTSTLLAGDSHQSHTAYGSGSMQQGELPNGKQQVRQEGTMDVVQEEIKVGKRTVDRGGVRVIQRVSEKPVRELIRLREERATVDRRAVDRPATAEDLSNFREGTIEVRETTEEPVVAKSARVVEEVRVGKDVQEREQTIEDTVRRKDVDVERMEGEGPTSMERERAVASDTTRDPDAAGTPGTERKTTTGRKTLKKPPRNT
jgi:stress response protein YsnF